MTSSYASVVPRPLLACPFCREIYPKGETDGKCPECGVKLEPLEKLPLSLEALAEDAELGQMVAPEDRSFPWHHLGRGRGALVAIGVASLASHFLPWVFVSSPSEETFTGVDMATRLVWLWGGFAAWFVLLPLVLSRRTVTQMRGVRVIAVVFTLMTLAEILILVLFPPEQPRYVTYRYTWGWGLYLNAALSILGTWFAVRFGGRVDDLEAVPWTDDDGRRRVESSTGQVLH